MKEQVKSKLLEARRLNDPIDWEYITKDIMDLFAFSKKEYQEELVAEIEKMKENPKIIRAEPRRIVYEIAIDDVLDLIKTGGEE